MDLYAILGVTRGAGPADIRRAYRRLAEREPRRIVLIQADQSLNQVTRLTWQAVQKKMAVMRERCHAL